MRTPELLRLPRLLLLVAGHCLSAAAQPATNSPSTRSIQSEMDGAIHQVEKIVNQPVLAYRHAAGMQVSVYSPGWFHEGASKPDFNNVDVRTTQETPYAQHEYVTSDLNPGLVFLGRDLEFNSMTKYFYTNRTLPKKKLTDAEMQEINRLYRIIGRCELQLAKARHPNSERTTPDTTADTDSTTPPGKRPRLLNPYIGGGGILLLLLLILVARRGK